MSVRNPEFRSMLSTVRRLVVVCVAVACVGCGGGGPEAGFPADVSGPAPAPPTPKDAPDMKSLMKPTKDATTATAMP